MHFDDWYKKQVTLHWGNVRFELDVAQELFSSHEVDSGSMLLLRSLANTEFPAAGRCMDFGCGYGILGLAWKACRPDWSVMLIDRDALAVEFSAHNAQRLGYEVDCRGGLDPVDPAGTGYDLLLWNVPGKAGPAVLAELMADSLDVIAPHGVLALVVVHPLAETLRDVAEHRDGFTIERDERGPEHTILHVRRLKGMSQANTDAFARGVFDRESLAMSDGVLEYRLTPVIGLPQYDGPDYATQLVLDALNSMSTFADSDVLIVRSGVGHVPLAVATHWPDLHHELVDRDLLALKSSRRALEQAGIPTDSISTRHAADLHGMQGHELYDLSIVMLDHQMRAPVMQRLLDELAGMSAPGAQLILGGSSTEVSRAMAILRRHPMLNIRARTRRKGFSAMIAQRR